MIHSNTELRVAWHSGLEDGLRDSEEGSPYKMVPNKIHRPQESAMSETQERVHIEDGPKRVRTYLAGELIADTKHLKLVWEVPYYPAYYFPRKDVRMELLTPNGHTKRSPSRGDAHNFTVKGGDREVEDAAWNYPESPVEELRDLIRFDWNAMDGWFEEDEEVFVHPHDPYTRIDILHSSRHVEVEVNGVKIADTHRPTLLFETRLPTRYYIPKLDVRMDLLTPIDTVTGCAYKGFAEYWSVRAGGETVKDLAWSYKTPLPENVKIAGLVAFYNEWADFIVDGERQTRPKTKFS
jgi:uncharacterized protein (DUF427 family)